MNEGLRSTAEITNGLVIAQTYMVQPRADREAHYQIHARTMSDPLPRKVNGRSRCLSPDCGCRLFLTRNERVFWDAVDFEGTGRTASIEWHSAKRDGQPCDVATAITRDTSVVAA